MMKVTSRAGLSPLGAYHSLMYGRSMYFDLARTKRELGWTPRYGNVEMFCDSYDWYLRHREEVLARHGASHHKSPVRQGVLRARSAGRSRSRRREAHRAGRAGAFSSWLSEAAIATASARGAKRSDWIDSLFRKPAIDIGRPRIMAR